MKKYIIVFCVVIISVLFIIFLIKSQKSLSGDILEVADKTNVIQNNPQTKIPAKSTDSNLKVEDKNITKVKEVKKIMNATLHTNKGDITVEFYEKDAPKTVENYTKLAKEGFYDGVKFHRVIKGFMIQAGDPLSKDDSKMAMWGTGGPGYKFADEINPNSELYKTGYKKGILAMANSGPNTNGSQFFIMNEDYPLPPLYTIFGKVTSGQDVVDKIAVVPTAPGDRPISPVVINSISLN